MFEVEAILAYDNELDEDGVVWAHSDVPHDLWVLGDKRMENSLRNAAEVHPISIDPTFNHGLFEVTPVTFCHPFIEAKSKNANGKWADAIMIGPTVIHHEKTDDAFDSGLRPIARKCNLTDASFGVITDGELALINACKRNFPKSTDLRCSLHFKGNCKDFLKSSGITSENDQAPLLEIVFGGEGLIEAQDYKELEKRLRESETLIRDIEESLLPTKEDIKSFYDYLTERKKSVLSKLIRDKRKKVGMPCDIDGVPSRVYTNQCEAANSILAAKKLALGYSKKDDMSKGQFLRNVWQSVVNEQELEISLALYGQSERYRLKNEAKYLQISVEERYNWSESKRKRFVHLLKFLRKLFLGKSCDNS